MPKFPSERCPKCELPEGEVVEFRMQATKSKRRASKATPRKIGPKRITGEGFAENVRFGEMPSIVTLHRCKKCGHEFTKTTAPRSQP